MHAIIRTWLSVVRQDRADLKDFQWSHRMVKGWVDAKPNPKKNQRSAEAKVDTYVASSSFLGWVSVT
jgi:hypothetical protein